MSDDKHQDEAWEFKVESEEKKDKVSRKKASLKSPKIKKNMGLDFEAMPDRVTRGQQARGEKKKKRPKRKKRPNYPSLLKRLQANIIDFILVLAVVVGTYLFNAELFIFPPEHKVSIPLAFRSFVSSYGPLIVIVISSHICVNILPALLFAKSIGKMMCGILICSKTGARAGIIQIFYREFFAKPISLSLVIGPLLFILNKRKRALHDFIAGTCLYKG